ncbi:uncharacterized protein ARMOST_21857 [Armillaria ostoyae]|uniref:Uncharacterized protein n=1 Tax=Armillaria ostoyae TaxID=47428 RepID=A0A284SB95_ARMOS|nr:uncharacterized protein ARMOST_21857 [Armillaria ostoyae]
MDRRDTDQLSASFLFWSRCKRIDIASCIVIAGTMGLFGLHARCFVRKIQGSASNTRHEAISSFNVQFRGRSVDVFFCFCRVAPKCRIPLTILKMAGDYASDDTSRAQNSTSQQ